MRFMIMHEMTEEMERGPRPDPATFEGVGKLVEERLKRTLLVRSGRGRAPCSGATDPDQTFAPRGPNETKQSSPSLPSPMIRFGR